MKHKHYEMIVAKVENMELVVFSKNQATGEWLIQNDQETTEFGDCVEYFLCLPQHKDACLHWLNGGDAQAKDVYGNWLNCNTHKPEVAFSQYDGWACKETEFRIKPRKEKRWIVAKENALASMMYFNSKGSADKATMTHGEFSGGQVIEIEVEV